MRVAWLLVLLNFVGCMESPSDPAQAPSQERSFSEPETAVELKDPAINESSGLARSYAFPGRYYTHNDSGDSARFWRFDLDGRVEGPITVEGAKAVDWEDMASASIGGKNYLFFADIGDNAERRSSVQVYRVEEPSEGAKLAKADLFELRYPDGPHNAEAFMVGPGGDFWIVTKTGKGPSGVYRLASPAQPGSFTFAKMGAVEVGAALEPTKLVTGGDISADGKYLVVRTYVGAYEFVFGERWWEGKPRKVKTAAELQGEAIAYSLKGDEILTTSEFAPCRVSRVRGR